MSRIVTSIILLLSMGCQTDKSLTTTNSAPQVVITNISDGEVVLESYEQRVIAQVSDSNDALENLEVQWSYGDDIICDWSMPSNGGMSECLLIPVTTESILRVQVRDPQGATAMQSIALDVQETHPPEAEILSPTRSSHYYSDIKVVFEGMVSDAEDDSSDLLVEWHSDIDGDLDVATTPSATGLVDGAIYLSEGEHYLRMSVTDQTGKIGTANTSIVVGPPNSPPICGILSPQSNASQGTDVVAFEANAVDPDVAAQELHVEWSSDKDGALGISVPNSDGSIEFSTSLSINTHVISLLVRDEVGEVCSDSILYTIGTPPSIAIVSPVNGDVINEGDPVHFIVEVYDMQDAPEDVVLTWTLDGDAYSNFAATSSGTAEFSDVGLGFGNHILSIVGRDTDGLTDSAQVSFVVNALPTAPVVSVLPSNPTTVDTLSVGLTLPSTDPEGSTVSYTYQWYKNNILQPTQSNDFVLASNTVKGDVWSVRVTPNDGLASGSYGAASVVIQNTAPSISALAITPNNALNDDVVTCSASAFDPDESVVPTYAWNVQGSMISGSTLDLSTLSALPNDVVECIATVTDGDGVTVTDSTSILLGNRPPVINAASVSPVSPASNSNVSCNFSVSDLDGGTLTSSVSWYNGGSLIGTGTNLQLDSSLVNVGDAISCLVDSSDSIDSTSLASSPVNIINTVPSTPTVSITSSNHPDNPIEEEDDLTCEVLPPSIDIDGDTVYYTFDWTDPNGTLIGGGGTATTDTFDILPATEPTFAGEWQCTVTVSDGIDIGGSDSAIITVDPIPYPLDCHVRENGSTYLFCTSALTWNQAENVCTSVGAHLVTINNSTEENWLVATGETIYSYSSGARWWIGYNDISIEGNYGWVSGISSGHSHWGSGEPNNSGNEDCVSLMWAGVSNGWNDYPCGNTVGGYICEM